MKKLETLSIIVPCYNEEKTLKMVVRKLIQTDINIPQKEIVIVDDHSTDSSLSIAKNLASQYDIIKVYSHDVNRGKGAALKTGFTKCSGDVIVCQDADLEYNPEELNLLLEPIMKGKASVVYGSRFLTGLPHRVLSFWHSFGNKLLTFLSNTMSDLNLTDMETCYKMFTQDVIEAIELKEKRFGVEPELTAKIASLSKEKRFAIYEVGISYSGRSSKEGKKIGLKDAISALRCIIKYNSATPAKLIKYLINGLVVAFSQLISITAIVEILNQNNKAGQIGSYAISIEISILVGLFLHSYFTWKYPLRRSRKLFNLCMKFHLITAFSFAVRMILFSILFKLGMNYLPNTLIGIAVAIILNFIGYDKLVFKKD